MTNIILGVPYHTNSITGPKTLLRIKAPIFFYFCRSLEVWRSCYFRTVWCGALGRGSTHPTLGFNDLGFGAWDNGFGFGVCRGD